MMETTPDDMDILQIPMLMHYGPTTIDSMYTLSAHPELTRDNRGKR